MADAVLSSVDLEAGVASRRRLISRIVIYGLLTVFALFYIVPLLVVVVNSFRPLQEIATNGLMKSNGGLTLWYSRNGFEARLAANHHSAYNRAPTWDSTAFQLNGAETWVSANISQQVTSQLQLRLGVENATNQRVTYANPLTPLRQTNFQFGRRFNVGVTYKM